MHSVPLALILRRTRELPWPLINFPYLKNYLLSLAPVTVIPDLQKKKIILEEEEEEAVVATNHTHHETQSNKMLQDKKDEGTRTHSGTEDIWQLKEKRSLNTVQCDKHKLQENDSRRNPDTIKQPVEFDDRKQDSDKDEDKQPVEESRKKESKLSPLMKIEEKFRGRSFLSSSCLNSM